ncbi:MAG: carboxymuconolactone decarboxylase family protein [Rhodospirillaceae bacterium]|mgnify:FL=1|jgi:alkylhydroperoxidase family enzyme|nr:carboxymuconolactone decarboxylase family protein [Rhodospirillaceae bacterium]MBT5191552.1 carboxymuconolactone decarboxylase family protein [Rhodospirillaceae bacterium]MBT5894680.1 carboxymuconolactone decarboxylase family protein [Rhodospirillaceae bacterium]MBT6428046.1 carboxymuconolactone decarboxylase family protein [Rhodospirillaceae bacterium]MBT7756763.1 carboxymuconolactone decarboxylase family protein [Rhodospirillaceae bacterium]
MAGTEPRIPMLPEDEARAIGKEVGVPSTMAGLNVFRIMSQHPTLAGVVAKQLAMLLYRGNKLDERLRELIIMRIGWRTGAMYEWTQHWPVSLRIGLTEEETLAVRDPANATCLGAAELAVIAATDDVLDNGAVGEASWQACAEHLASNEERLELVAAICNWNTFSIMLKSLNIPLEDGVAAWPPDGVPSPAAD